MAFQFTTGSATLPDIGSLSYNGVTFSSLFHTNLNGQYTPDSSKRTTKFVQYTLNAEGNVTLDDTLDVGNARTIDRIMGILRTKLEQCAAPLTYSGRGFGQAFSVNTPGSQFDVCWGPVPTVIAFEPCGGLSAYVKWSCMFTLPEVKAQQIVRTGPGIGPVLEFTSETNVTYGEDWYSTVSIKGTVEIPLTRPTQATKTLTTTADDFRRTKISQISQSFDLTRFKVSTRNFSVSRDKRTIEYEFVLEELPPMGLPNFMPKCSGNFSVRPAKDANSLVATLNWVCSLRVTYTVPPIFPRRTSYLHFAGIWQLRMRMGLAAVDPAAVAQAQQAVQQANAVLMDVVKNAPTFFANTDIILNAAKALQQAQQKLDNVLNPKKTWPIHFSVNEGLYEDSKRITFEARWRLITSLQNILVSSGVWTQTDDRNSWAKSVSSISGPQSWLLNKLDPSGQAIVDFGS